MSKKSKEIIDKIDASKQVLSTMPQNNIKNKKIYQKKVEELEEEYQQYKEEIAGKLQKKYQKFINIEEDKEVENLEKRIESIKYILKILDDDKTSFEKMELDKSIYIISRYYKDNLENINEQIKQCINKFKTEGIIITIDDFKYSIYSQEYMKVFFQEMTKENINSDKLKEIFEEIYWKCPEIIKHIELNLRHIYLEKKQMIDKYFENEKNEKIKQFNINQKEIKRKDIEVRKMLMEKNDNNPQTLKNEFINGKLNIKDFSNEKIKANIQKVLSKEIANEIEENKETQENINKCLNSLYEYQNYNEFKFIVDDIKKYYKDKEKYKKSYEITKKEIDKLEKKLHTLNKKVIRKGLFRVKKVSYKQTPEIKDVIQNLSDKYKTLELNKFYSKIYSNLNDNSSIYDVLKLAYSYYFYLTTIIIQNFEDITQEEIDEKINKLGRFLENPYNTIITNTNILDENDIAIVIKDRYKLLGFNIEKEDMSPNEIDSYITKLKNIQISINLKNANIDIKQIEQFCEIKKMLKL